VITFLKRADGATFVGLYLLTLLVIPAQLVISRLPMAIAPSLMVAAGVGALCLCGHLVSSVQVAKGRSIIRTALILFLAANILTYAVATRRYLPPDELSGADNGMIRVFATVGMAIAVCDAVRGREQLDRVLKVFLGAAAFVGLVGFLQFAVNVDLVPYLHLPGLTANNNFDYVLERGSFRRPSGTTNHPIEFGMVCALAVPIGLHFAFRAVDRSEPAGRWWAFLSLVVIGAVTSLSRTAILGLLVAGIIVVLVLPRRHKLVAGVAGLGLFGVAGLVVPGLLGTLYGLFANISSDPSVTARVDDYTYVAKVIDMNPLLGRGFGTFFPNKYILLDNQYLMTIIETGYIGLATLIMLFLAVAIAAVFILRGAVDGEQRSLGGCLLASVAVAVVGAGTFDLFSFGLTTGIMFFLIGAIGAHLRTVRQDRTAAGRPVGTGKRTGAGVA
jgi:O-antigen ligase